MKAHGERGKAFNFLKKLVEILQTPVDERVCVIEM